MLQQEVNHLRNQLQTYGASAEYLDQEREKLEREQRERAEKERQFKEEMEQVFNKKNPRNTQVPDLKCQISPVAEPKISHFSIYIARF